MRTLIALALLLLFVDASVAQVKQWTDEKGVTHFEAQGTGKVPERRERDSTASKPRSTKVPIERSHSGATLGDNESAMRNTNYWAQLQGDEPATTAYSKKGRLPDGMVNFSLLYFDGRLLGIHILYDQFGFAPWNREIEKLAAKYGPPDGDEKVEAQWSDSKTNLRITKDKRDFVTAVIVDRELLARWRAKTGRDTPKF